MFSRMKKSKEEVNIKNEIRFETTGRKTDIDTPYNPEFISRLNSALGTRKYNPEKRCWTIDTAVTYLILSNEIIFLL